MSKSGTCFTEYHKYAKILIDTIDTISQPSFSVIEIKDFISMCLTADSDQFCENITEFVEIVKPFMLDHIAISSGKPATNNSILCKLGTIPGELVERNYEEKTPEEEYLNYKYSILSAVKNGSSWQNNLLISSDNKYNFPKTILKIFGSFFKTVNGVEFVSDPIYQANRSKLSEVLAKGNVRKFTIDINKHIGTINTLFQTYYVLKNNSLIDNLKKSIGKNDMSSEEFIGNLGGGIYINIKTSTALNASGLDLFSLDFHKNIVMKLIIEYMNENIHSSIIGMSFQPYMILSHVDRKSCYDIGVLVRFYLKETIITKFSDQKPVDKSQEVSDIIASFIHFKIPEFEDADLKQMIKPAPQKIYLPKNQVRHI